VTAETPKHDILLLQTQKGGFFFENFLGEIWKRAGTKKFGKYKGKMKEKEKIKMSESDVRRWRSKKIKKSNKKIVDF